MKYKQQILAFIFACQIVNLFGQTKISANIGLDFSHVPIQSALQPKNTFSAHGSVFGGLVLQRGIRNQLSVVVSSDISHKKVRYGTRNGYVNYSHIRFYYLQQRILVNYAIDDKYSIGIGPSVNWLFKLRTKWHDGSNLDLENRLFEYGICFNFTQKWKKFDTNIYFCQGVKKNYFTSSYTTIKPIQSLGIALSYKLMYFEKNKAGGSSCPKF